MVVSSAVSSAVATSCCKYSSMFSEQSAVVFNVKQRTVKK